MAAHKVTIVIPCYNHADYVGEAIESALAQTVPCDVIVVNNGSTDNSSEVIARYPVKLMELDTPGLCRARNTGIAAATTEWIFPLDADDKLAPSMVERCLTGDSDIIGVGQQLFGTHDEHQIFMPEPTYQDFYDNNRINCASLHRKAMWEAIGGYDEQMTQGYEDWDYWLRATRAGYTVKTVPEVLYLYRKHGHSLTTTAIANHFELLHYIRAKHTK